MVFLNYYGLFGHRLYVNVKGEDEAARRYRLLNRAFEIVDIEELRDRSVMRAYQM